MARKLENPLRDGGGSTKHPRYPLATIRQLIKQDDVLIGHRALEDARNCFGWGVSDILGAISRLQPEHFWKSERSRKNPDYVIDVYRAENLNGEDVYTHFYIDEDVNRLIIDSFHKK